MPLKRSALPVVAPTVPDDEWVDLDAAAARLGVSGMAVGHYMAADRLVAARNHRGETGVTQQSLAQEAEYRAHSNRLGRAWRRIRESWVYL